VQSTQRVGNSVGLLLPEGSLKAGDQVVVTWNDGNIALVVE
jgi:hypothetical protein